MPCRHSLSWANFSKLSLAVTLLIGGLETARAQSPYQLRTGCEWTLVGVGAALSVSGLVFINDIKPFTETELADLNTGDINSFDRSGMEPYRENVAGDVLHFASLALPLTLLADERTRRDWQTLGVMWGEVLLLNTGVTALTKGLVQRTRPYAYDVSAPMEKRAHEDAKVSFFSGHTSATAATCFFLANVVSDYPFSKSTKTIAWSAAGVVPAVVGYLRVDSGHHFRTDVITGYLLGAAVGVLVPRLHRAMEEKHSSIRTTVSGGQLLLSFEF